MPSETMPPRPAGTAGRDDAGVPAWPDDGLPPVIARRLRMTAGLVAAIYAPCLFLVLAATFARYPNGLAIPGDPAWHFPYAFTNQVNTLAMAWLAVFAVANLGQGRLAQAARRLVRQGLVTGLMLCLAVMFLSVSCVLNPFYTGAFEAVLSGGGLYLHICTPIVVLTLYLLYPWPDRATWRSLLGWIGYLAVYVGVVNLVGSRVSWRGGERAYAYSFLDPSVYPSPGVYVAVILGLLVAAFGLGVGLLRLKARFDAGFRPGAAQADGGALPLSRTAQNARQVAPQ